MTDVRQAYAAFLRFSPVAGEATNDSVRVFFAPGRVNLIGEHIDYNGGRVFPAALTLGTWLFVRPRTDGVFRFASSSFAKTVEVHGPPQAFTYRPEDDFANYPKGVLWVLAERGLALSGGDFYFHGNLPYGAGLSSSASVEVATAVAVSRILQADLSAVEIAQLTQRAENQFVGVNCGIMDQFAVAAGAADAAIALNCATLDFELVPARMSGCRLVITNTNQRRGLADSKYNERRSECEQALAQVQAVHPEIRHLADIPAERWQEFAPLIPDATLKRRARHVVTENGRVNAAIAALRAGKLQEFGRLLNESHQSLRDDYEVTGFALDALAEAAWSAPGCLGSRMTGAGFGGCTVSLVQEDQVSAFQAHVQAHYQQATGIAPSFYVTDIGPGAREVTEEVKAECPSW
ncbi:MAG: galactokinase [Alicyclobacillus herbarius]|uniref:galactokinase n=1 Tax=Alicyclobacillus herbarius TaxID=122960 RepID=UPI0004029868|nr:galactokinase [Alicyclobacillus herbarius]MCL6631157.1 galactokinase [Alicyclobacillus herbarius]